MSGARASGAAPRRPVVLAPGEGVRLQAGPNLIVLRVTSEYSERFTLLEYRVGPRFTAPPTLHHHTREDWAAHVLAGEVVFVFDDGEVQAGPGTAVFVPAGAGFAWRNDRDEEARYLAVHAPAGFDRFFVDAASAVSERGGPSPEVMAEVIPPLWARYGVEPARQGGAGS